MDRRTFLGATVAGGFAGWFARGETAALGQAPAVREQFGPAPTFGIIPVVGDGKWIWTEPPVGDTGYLEPRPYEAKIGVRIDGTGSAGQLMATTVIPVALPEQRLDDVRVESQGCTARVRMLSREAAQLFLVAPSIARGQTIAAAVHFRLTLHKSYHGYEKAQFPAEQTFDDAMRKQYLFDSPGIQTRFKPVRELQRQVGGEIKHPWDRAKAFHAWVWENIKGRPQIYTSVIEAIRERVGDCEERAATFVALCRASGIPARLVWVPNHNWAEFYLRDESGQGHWIPSHTSAYSWFGWTGAHELILQKGDSITVPEKRKPQRLLADWMQWQGSRPKARYLAELTPLPTDSEADAGPGARRKDEKGEWVRIGNHPLNSYLRDGPKSAEKPPASLTSEPSRSRSSAQTSDAVPDECR